MTYPNTQTFKDLVAYLVHNEITFSRVGSSKIKGIGFVGDYDLLILDEKGKVFDFLTSKGWELGGSNLPTNIFHSFKDTQSVEAIEAGTKVVYSNLTNAILVKDLEKYGEYVSAQKICEEQKILNKQHRIMVFEYIRNEAGKCSEEEFVNLCTLGRPRKEAYSGFPSF